MARKAKKSSCQVKHWWEAKGSRREDKWRWQNRTDKDTRFIIRHAFEGHYLERQARPDDLLQVSLTTLRRIGLEGIVNKLDSMSAALRHAYPEFFDYARRDHVHEWDFGRKGQWQYKSSGSLARSATRHMIKVHWLGRAPRAEDLPKITNALLEKLGLSGLLSAFKRSTLGVIRHAYPEFFDYARPDHVHEWDFKQQGAKIRYKNRERTNSITRHMIEEHYLGRPACPADLLRMTGQTFFQIGLGGVLVAFGGSPNALLRHAYPEFFDYSRLDHLHEWDIRRNNVWQKNNEGDVLARTAIRHMIEVHYLERSASAEDLVNLDWKTLYFQLGLSGMMSQKFASSRTATLRHAYPEFAEAIGSRIKGTADFFEVLENEDPQRTRKLLKDLMSHFGDDLVDVADILAVVYTGRLEAKTAMEILQDPTMRPWIVPFDGRGHGPGKPPIGDDFPFYLLEKDQNGVIAGIIRRRLTEWRRKVLGARPSKEARARFLRELRTLQEKFRTNGGK